MTRIDTFEIDVSSGSSCRNQESGSYNPVWNDGIFASMQFVDAFNLNGTLPGTADFRAAFVEITG